MFSSVPAGSGTSSISSTTPRDEARRARRSRSVGRARKSISRAGGLLRDGDRRQPEHDALERRRDRARVGDVVAEVRAVVDARRRSARPRSRRSARASRGARSRPACRRSRSRRVPSPKSTSSTHSGRRVVIERAIAERLPSGAITAELDARHAQQRAAQRLQALGLDAVVVGEQHLHGLPSRGYVSAAVAGTRTDASASPCGGAVAPALAARRALQQRAKSSSVRRPAATSSIVPTSTRFMWRMNVSA